MAIIDKETQPVDMANCRVCGHGNPTYVKFCGNTVSDGKGGTKICGTELSQSV